MFLKRDLVIDDVGADFWVGEDLSFGLGAGS